jgi:hypothetical protein
MVRTIITLTSGQLTFLLVLAFLAGVFCCHFWGSGLSWDRDIGFLKKPLPPSRMFTTCSWVDCRRA